MKCNDCNGTGSYQGFVTIERCKTCNGTGQVQIVVPDSLPSDQDLDITGGLREGRRPMIPAVGEKIYYYGEDVEGEVTHVNADDQYFEATFTCGRGHGKFRDLVWNITHDRWEVTRSRVQ